MDKRTLIGLIVIGAILFGFTWYNSSIQEKRKNNKRLPNKPLPKRSKCRPQMLPPPWWTALRAVPRHNSNNTSA